MTVYAASNSNLRWIGRFVDDATYRQIMGNNSEIAIRIFGDNLQITMVAGGANPFWMSLDGAGWTTPTIASGGPTLSGNLISGASDALHTVRLRMKDGFTGGGTKVRLTDAFTVTSTGGVADLTVHPDYVSYERTRGTNAGLYWSETFGDTIGLSGFASPIFPMSKKTGNRCPARGAYAEFLVDTNTTKLSVFTQNNSIRFSIWVSEGSEDNLVRQAMQILPGTTNGTYGLNGPYAIPGTGQRRVRVTNLSSLDGVVIDGAFVASAVPQPTKTIAWFGDSTDSADSAITGGNDGVDDETDSSGGWESLCQQLLGTHRSFNLGLSGDEIDAVISFSRVTTDITPRTPDYVIFNIGLNDGAEWASDGPGTQAQYVTVLEDILTQNPATKIIVIPYLPYQASNRAAVIAGLQGAVADVADARCTYQSSDGWTCADRSGLHPFSTGYAESTGFGVASIKIAAQPADGDTVTINGTVFEFDSNATVTGGNTAVTIGGNLVATINALGDAIVAAGGTFRLFERLIISTNLSHQGIVVRGCTSLAKSGTNITVYGPIVSGFANVLHGLLNVTVTEPEALDVVTEGDNVTVDATEAGTSGDVDILLSLDGGDTFPINLASSETLPYAWVPTADHVSATAVIRVRDSADHLLTGDSGEFEVEAAVVPDPATPGGGGSVPTALYGFAALRNTLRTRSQNCDDPRLTDAQRVECRKRRERISRIR